MKKKIQSIEAVEVSTVDTSEMTESKPKFSTKKVNGHWYLVNQNDELVNKFGEPVETVGEAFRYHDEFRANQSCKWLNER